MTLALQLFKNSNDPQEKLRLNFHSLSVSVSELSEYGRIQLFQLRLFPEQSGKVEYERDLSYSRIRLFRFARMRLFRFARGTTLIEIAVMYTETRRFCSKGKFTNSTVAQIKKILQ
jgi:hypothetical protein